MKCFCLVLLFSLVASCTEYRPTPPVSIESDPIDTIMAADKNYKGLRVYEGTVPCADCPGIFQQLVLKGDSLGIYRLKEIYKEATEDGDSELISSGEWKRVKDGSVYNYYLSEKNIKDSVRVTKYRIEGDKIFLLPAGGDTITPLRMFSLKLTRSK